MMATKAQMAQEIAELKAALKGKGRKASKAKVTWACEQDKVKYPDSFVMVKHINGNPVKAYAVPYKGLASADGEILERILDSIG
jgi:hypothetical protein